MSTVINSKVVPYKGNHYISRWGSVEEFAAAAKYATEHRCPGGGTSSTSHPKGDHRWDLGQGFDLVHERAVHGWPEATKQIRDTVVPLVDKITAQIEQDHYDFVDDGSIASGFDVPTLLTGEPSHWLQHATEIVEGKGQRIIRIGSATRNTADVSAQGMFRRGVITAALAYCLEAAGFGVEIIGVGKTQGKAGCYYSFTKVKGAGDLLDLNRVAVAVANPGFQRRLDFAIRESDERLKRLGVADPDFYGRSTDLDASEIREEKLDIYVPVGAARVPASQLVDYVLTELRKQGVKIKGDKAVA